MGGENYREKLFVRERGRGLSGQPAAREPVAVEEGGVPDGAGGVGRDLQVAELRPAREGEKAGTVPVLDKRPPPANVVTSFGPVRGELNGGPYGGPRGGP